MQYIYIYIWICNILVFREYIKNYVSYPTGIKHESNTILRSNIILRDLWLKHEEAICQWGKKKSYFLNIINTKELMKQYFKLNTIINYYFGKCVLYTGTTKNKLLYCFTLLCLIISVWPQSANYAGQTTCQTTIQSAVSEFNFNILWSQEKCD